MADNRIALHGFATTTVREHGRVYRARRVVFVAHPLGTGLDRDANISNAKRWVVWLAEQGYAPLAPWTTLAEHWTENRREQGLDVGFAILRQCQGLVLCGGRMSPGMQRELDEAKRLGLPHLDLLHEGYAPPSL